MSTIAHQRGLPRIAVIGGGISGLAAAFRLTELATPAAITLFESSGRLGGVLETARRDGYLVERSADNFLTTRPAGIALCRRLGMADALLPTDETRRAALVVRDGRLIPVPAGFYLMSPRLLWPLVTSPLISLAGKLRLLAEPLVPPRRNRSEPGVEFFAGDDDESVASFARRRLGREAFERLVQPLVAGIYTADSNKLSMAATMPQFLEYERQYGSLLRATLGMQNADFETRNEVRPKSEIDDTSGARYSAFVAPRDGLASLVSAIVERLSDVELRLNTRVNQLRHSADDLWRLDLEGQNNSEAFDAVIIAAPTFAAARMLEALDPPLAAELAAITYSSCAVVNCAFRRQQIANPLDGFGFVVPQIEGRRIVAGSFASNKFPGRAPNDCVLVRTFVGGSLQPELVDLPDVDLRRLVLDELGDLLRITGTPQWVEISRWPQSMPQYHVGHLARVARIERLVARSPGMELAGNAYRGVGIPQCISSGEAAAERVTAFLEFNAKRAGH